MANTTDRYYIAMVPGGLKPWRVLFQPSNPRMPVQIISQHETEKDAARALADLRRQSRMAAATRASPRYPVNRPRKPSVADYMARIRSGID